MDRQMGRHFALRTPDDEDGVESDLSQSNMKPVRRARLSDRDPVPSNGASHRMAPTRTPHGERLFSLKPASESSQGPA